MYINSAYKIIRPTSQFWIMPSTKAYNASCRVEYLNEHSVLKKRSQNHVRLHFSSKIPYSFDTRGTVTLGRTRKFIPPPWYKGGGGGVDGTPPRSFWHAAVFRNDFTFSGNPLIFLTRWGIFHGWWRCWRSVTSPTMIAIRIRNQVKTARNCNFCALHEKQHINKHFALFLPQDLLLLLKEVEKTCILNQKWLDHLLLMTSDLVTIATHRHWTCLKKCSRVERTAIENVRCWCFIL